MSKEKNVCNGFCCCNCCFSKFTNIIVKENGKIINKYIQDVKIDDYILTLLNGEKVFTKVNFKKDYDDEYKFYEFKCIKGNKTKNNYCYL